MATSPGLLHSPPLSLSSPQTHPYHSHPLIKTDTRQVYREYESRWKCDVCHKSYDGRSEDPRHRYAYHCTQCRQPDYFDCCTDCFEGYLHSFHCHRLQPGRSDLCYPETEGTWRCDACQRVFGALSNQLNYHCKRCQVDICNDCFRGKWRHVLHCEGRHTLVPIDPRIEYRCYDSWSCEVCGMISGHGHTHSLMFHCKQCEEDICANCFKGYTHHLHQHGIVQREREEDSWETLYCSICSRQLLSLTYYSCRFPNCLFNLCISCFQAPPRPHPLHPEHPLYVTDSTQAYPEAGGVWHCDSCANNSGGKSSGLTSMDVMYHCSQCEFDLCETCYRSNPRRQDPPRPPSSAPPLSQQYNFFSNKDQYRHQPIITRPSVNFIPSPPSSLPAPSLCRVCGLATARLTPTHMGVAHSEAFYCQECAKTVLDSKERCFKCGQLPDGMVMV